MSTEETCRVITNATIDGTITRCPEPAVESVAHLRLCEEHASIARHSAPEEWVPGSEWLEVVRLVSVEPAKFNLSAIPSDVEAPRE